MTTGKDYSDCGAILKRLHMYMCSLLRGIEFRDDQLGKLYVHVHVLTMFWDMNFILRAQASMGIEGN